jgi:molybdopterin synthase catalytic subunit
MLIRVQAEDFDPGREIERLSRGSGSAGAVASFVGLVRGGEVTALTLEHYPGMTERQLTAIAEEGVRRFAVDDVTILHRVGRLLPADRIVFVGTAARHRAEAFAACAFLVDWLKTKAPFWKCETTTQGERWVTATDEDDICAARWL